MRFSNRDTGQVTRRFSHSHNRMPTIESDTQLDTTAPKTPEFNASGDQLDHHRHATDTAHTQSHHRTQPYNTLTMAFLRQKTTD